MKHKTYLVTIEDDKAYTTEDVRNALDLYAGIDPECLTVTDITATHAKEREVLKAANDLASAERDRSALLISFAMGDIRKATRELRALMEGKA